MAMQQSFPMKNSYDVMIHHLTPDKTEVFQTLTRIIALTGDWRLLVHFCILVPVNSFTM